MMRCPCSPLVKPVSVLGRSSIHLKVHHELSNERQPFIHIHCKKGGVESFGKNIEQESADVDVGNSCKDTMRFPVLINIHGETVRFSA